MRVHFRKLKILLGSTLPLNCTTCMALEISSTIQNYQSYLLKIHDLHMSASLYCSSAATVGERSYS